MVLKIETFSAQRSLKSCCIILFHHFVELGTLELDAKILGFFEFLSFNPNIQPSAK